MKRLVMMLAAVGAVAALSGGPATAQAESQAKVLGPVVLNDDGTASVRARYVCNETTHLWVSAKQAEDGKPDRRLQEEHSSQHATGWMQSHPAAEEFTCDGRWHTGTFAIETTNFGPGAEWEALRRGQAWVQFCLTSESEEGEFIYDYRWIAVKKADPS